MNESKANNCNNNYKQHTHTHTQKKKPTTKIIFIDCCAHIIYIDRHTLHRISLIFVIVSLFYFFFCSFYFVFIYVDVYYTAHAHSKRREEWRRKKMKRDKHIQYIFKFVWCCLFVVFFLIRSFLITGMGRSVSWNVWFEIDFDDHNLLLP